MKHTQPFDTRSLFLKDAKGQIVLTCFDPDFSGPDGCRELWDGPFIDANALFICPNCGRIGIRMVEALSKDHKETKPTKEGSQAC